MRSTWFLVLPLLFILAVSTRVSMSVAGGRPAKASRAAVKQETNENEYSVIGRGKTSEDAKTQAFKNAKDKVKELLLERYAAAGWLPPAELLEPKRLQRAGAVVLEGEPKQVDGTIEGEKEKTVVFVATCKVALTKDYLREVEKAARQERVEERHVLLIRVLVGLLAVCLVVTGYLRLDEWTRGYATKLLRLSAAVLLLAAIAGLLLTR